MVSNERIFLRKISQSTPEELKAAVRGADAQEERILRTYLGSAQFDTIHTLAVQGDVTRGGAASLGKVVVLHGIMGGELNTIEGDSQNLLWVQILRLIQGQFGKLALDAQGASEIDVRASGMYMRFYGSQLARLSQQWTVRPFYFDWRRDIRLAADELHTSINTWFGPDEPVHLVGHSMGGLVARSYIVKHKDRWDKGGRLIMLGTPNYGSFAIPRLLFGTNDILAIVSKIDFAHDARDLLNTAKTFTGAYQMLPVLNHLPGLDVLYKAATYSVVPIDQRLLDQAAEFQASIAGAVDPARMVYVAGYNKRTLAGINDSTQLGADAGYFLSLKGDGTVPHNLGLLPGVTTFYVDEEHQSLPANARVQAAMTELLQTGNLKDETFLFKGLSDQFAGERGAGEDQSSLLAGEAARRSLKEQQALTLRNALVARSDLDSQTISPEEQALADVMLHHDPLPLAISTDRPGVVVLPSPPDPHPLAGNAPPTAAPAPAPPASAALPLPRTSIRVRVVESRIEQLAPNAVTGEAPVDCIAVGHYLRVRPTGAEHDIDTVISPHYFKALPPGASTEDDLVLQQFHDRGILRGDLGVPFYLPDPRPGYENNLLAIGGMGPTGQFGLPELILLAREICWSSGMLQKRHLATVLIGASKRNLSFADCVHGWLMGLNRALASVANSGVGALQAITFVIPPATTAGDTSTRDAVVTALRREADCLSRDAMIKFDVQLIDLPPVKATPRVTFDGAAATRISIEFEDGVCRYSALTDGASIAERVFRIKPKRIADVNQRLLSTDVPAEKYRLGKFLLDFIFPSDLRSQLIGSAPVILACNNEAAKVYWELAAQPLEDDFTGGPAGDQPYLGLTRGLTRQLRTVLAPPPEPPPPVGRVLRVLLVANGCKERPLPGAEQEARLLQDLFTRINNNGSGNTVAVTALIGPSKATTLDVLLSINDQPPFDVLHYAGHCILDKANPQNSGFLFSGDDRLTADDLDRIDRTPKFVFANACESGVMPSRPDLASPELPAAFAEAFFKKGVANFICTAWPVGDSSSRDFAEELYKHLLGDDVAVSPMHEALRLARQKIAATHTWGAYQHYGNPYLRLFRRS